MDTDAIIVCGLNHHTAPLAVLEKFAFSREKARHAAGELRSRGLLREVVVLSTCNRSEVYGAASHLAHNGGEALRVFFGEFHSRTNLLRDGQVYLKTNQDAFRHLFRVAAGLDSLFLGEAEILGQVRDAYLAAQEDGYTGHVLNRLFQSALELGKRVRAETQIGVGPMSAAFAAVKLAEQIFGGLRRRSALVVGAGEMAQQTVAHFRSRKMAQIAVANRSEERARELASRVGGLAVGWNEWCEALAQHDILVMAAGGDGGLLTPSNMERVMQARSGRPLFVIDLGLPRNVAPECAQLYNLYVYALEDLNDIVEQNRKAREQEIPRVEALVEAQLAKFNQWLDGMRKARAGAVSQQERAQESKLS
jgi:glutamyl-tRNA reductase